MRLCIAAVLLGLGLAAGAVLPATSAAQVVRDTVPADTLQPTQDTVPPRDTIPARDTIPPRDTIPARLARAEMPGTVGLAESYRWTRPQFIGTGALTLLDLVERVPGVTSFHTGWIASPMPAAHLGSAARVRVFLDGVELVPMDGSGVADLHDIPLWALDEISLERGADELRIHARSWSVARTTTFTRTDFATGDENTNLYRAFAGRRFRNGLALQGAAEQYATSGQPGRGGGDQRTLLGRVGWASGHWSGDAFVMSARRTRDEHPRLLGTGGMPRFRGNRVTAYARAGYGDPERGAWAQLQAVTRSFREETPAPVGEEDEVPPDTTRWDSQYIAAAGFQLGPARFSATNRLHMLAGTTVNALEARALFGAGPLSLALRSERRGGGLSSVEEAVATLAPVNWLGVSAAAARRTAGTDVLEDGNLVTARGELGLRLGRLWFSGGAMHRGEVVVPGLSVFDTLYVAATDPAANGFFGGVRGRIRGDLGAAIWVVRWEEPGWYRPQVQARSEIFLHTMWLSRFPRGNFEIHVSVAHEHRSFMRVPRLDPGEAELGVDFAPANDFLTSLIEIRVLDAVLFWQQRFSITAVPELVPGFSPSPIISQFGVRWQFWN